MHACYPPCEVCREREERATQPAPQAGSSGEGLKVEMPSDWKMPVSPCLNSDSGACSVLDANGRSVARQLWCNEAKAIAYALNQVYTRIPPAQAEPVAAERINANNPSTVPERFRQCMIDAAEYIVPRAMNTPGAGYTTKEGVLQMLTDLLALSLNDGCIAAAWAFEQIVQSVPAKPALTSLPNWPPGAVADITAALDAELEQKVEAKEPWKPVAGEKVLVEAVVSEAIGSCIWVTTDGHTVHTIPLHLSQLRPLPVVQGENLGNNS